VILRNQRQVVSSQFLSCESHKSGNLSQHKSDIAQQIHKESNVYKMYLRTLTYVSASKLPSSAGFLARNYSKWLHIKNYHNHLLYVALGGLVVSVLATGPKVRGFDRDRGRWIFKGDKNPEHHFFLKGSKAVVNVKCRRFTACKRTLELVVPVGKIQRPFLTQVS
jgi:hypothetical protein